jgi:hypothetical protein
MHLWRKAKFSTTTKSPHQPTEDDLNATLDRLSDVIDYSRILVMQFCGLVRAENMDKHANPTIATS